MKPGNEAREGKRKEQMRRGRKERVYSGLPLLFLHLVAYLLDAEKFTLCDANSALVSTNARLCPPFPPHTSGSTKSAEETGPLLPKQPAVAGTFCLVSQLPASSSLRYDAGKNKRN